MYKPRRIFQIDGTNGGLLSIAERPDEDRVLLIISNGEAEVQIGLSKQDFEALTDLRYDLRFAKPVEPQADSALKVVA